MRRQLGPAAPAVSSPEAEALRRFRSFTSSALMHGKERPPALDGLRINQRRTEALLASWVDSAIEVSGGQDLLIREPLTKLVMQFRVYLRGTATGRKSRGAPVRSVGQSLPQSIGSVRHFSQSIPIRESSKTPTPLPGRCSG